MDFSLFLETATWVSIFTLTFMEIVLGVDNIIFISITAGKLPKEQQR
ncbi:MAG: TerC family protein, partial [Chitinophagales bacterium]|nr:TerC family protein [Chitinophagales bacterium]